MEILRQILEIVWITLKIGLALLAVNFVFLFVIGTWKAIREHLQDD